MVLSIFPQTIKNRKEIEHMMLNMDFVIRLLVAGILGTIIGLDVNTVPKKPDTALIFSCR